MIATRIGISNVQQNRTTTNSHNGSNNKQKVNNNRTATLEGTAALAIEGLKCILLVTNNRPRLCCC